MNLLILVQYILANLSYYKNYTFLRLHFISCTASNIFLIISAITFPWMLADIPLLQFIMYPFVCIGIIIPLSQSLGSPSLSGIYLLFCLLPQSLSAQYSVFNHLRLGYPFWVFYPTSVYLFPPTLPHL